jgi:hypothetical protein
VFEHACRDPDEKGGAGSYLISMSKSSVEEAMDMRRLTVHAHPDGHVLEASALGDRTCNWMRQNKQSRCAYASVGQCRQRELAATMHVCMWP